MIKKATFKIIGMHCTSCAMSIDGELEDTEGVRESNTNYAKQQTEVSFDPEKVNKNQIVSIIKRVGYNVTPTNQNS